MGNLGCKFGVVLEVEESSKTTPIKKRVQNRKGLKKENAKGW